MTTVMPPEVQATIDGIPSGHRPLFERLHRLILTAHPGAQVTLSYKMPACKAGNRRLYVGAWNMGILVGGWQKDRVGGFTSRHPELVTSKATLQLRDGDAAGISDEDFLGLAAPPWPPDPNPAGVPAKGTPAGSPGGPRPFGATHQAGLPPAR